MSLPSRSDFEIAVFVINPRLIETLMEKFEVAVALEQPEAAAGQPKEPQRWLIPELLPEAQPAAFAEFRQPGVKRLGFSLAIPRGCRRGSSCTPTS